jgi:hypothetical protein
MNDDLTALEWEEPPPFKLVVQVEGENEFEAITDDGEPTGWAVIDGDEPRSPTGREFRLIHTLAGKLLRDHADLELEQARTAWERTLNDPAATPEAKRAAFDAAERAFLDFIG